MNFPFKLLIVLLLATFPASDNNRTSEPRRIVLAGDFRAFEPINEKGADHTHLNLDGSRAVPPLVAKAFINAVPEVAGIFSDEAIAAAEIPQEYSTSLAQGELQLDETESVVTIRQSGKIILSYNKLSPPVSDGIDPIYQRSGFLHPVASPRWCHLHLAP